MRKIAEIRKDLNAKVEEVRGLEANSEAAVKGLEELNALVKELEAANQVEAAAQAAAEKKLNDLQKAAGQRFSLVKFIREASQRNLTGIELEAARMGAEEYKRLGLEPQGVVIPSALLRASTGNNAGTAGDGGNLVETMSARYVETLKEKLVVAQLGATLLTDLTGELPVITSAQIKAAWGAEGDEASVTKASYSKAVMKPHRNFVYCAVSKDLLRQTSYDVEADLMNKMVEAHANLIEAAALTGTGTSNQPTGLLTKSDVPVVEMGTNGAAIDWKKVVELETKVNSNNANRGRMAYLTNSKVWGALKTTEKATGTARFLLEQGMLNGYKAEYSNLIPSNLTKGTATTKCSAMVFGNFQDLYIGQWGGLDLVVDASSTANAIKAEIGIVLNAWNDVLVAEPKSFAVIKDILA